MNVLQKPTVTLGGVPVAASSSYAWKFTTGVQPYRTSFAVHHRHWPRLASRIGRPLTLEVVDSRRHRVRVEKLFILRQLPSAKPSLRTFEVVDKRWQWAYPSIHRDYNIPRKTGSRTADFETIPVEVRQTFDEYDYLAYSLQDGARRWTARKAVEDVLKQIDELVETPGFRIESWPLVEDQSASELGQFTLQGMRLRDPADIALSRVMSAVPGAGIYIDSTGEAVVFDTTDLDATEKHFRDLPPATWRGERAVVLDLGAVRPKKVVPHYTREVEAVFTFRDDYSSSTSADPARDAPYLDNVIPTVDPETEITEYDPQLGRSVTKTVAPGTWVVVKDWLRAMDADRPDGSLPWTFDTIKRHWFKGDLDGVLGGRGLDLDATANVAMRIQALKQHFRQTFRPNRRYAERWHTFRPVRAALLNKITGERAPAAVWGQACVIPSKKGAYMASRKDASKAKVFRNVDYLAPHTAGAKLRKTAPGPTRMSMIDPELGIFRLEWITSPYGDVESFLPCHLVGERTRQPQSITRDFSRQNDEPMGAAMQIEGGTNGIFLRDTLDLKVMATIVPAAPNNVNIYHAIEVEAKDVQKVFRKRLHVDKGRGPELAIIIPPGELTARFTWDDDDAAEETLVRLLGLDQDDPNTGGVDGVELPGYVLVNEDRHLNNHAVSVAAEMLSAYADSVQGNVNTRLPDDGVKLVGNMQTTALQISAAPSGRIELVHQFSGRQRPISRQALQPQSLREITLGVLPYA